MAQIIRSPRVPNGTAELLIDAQFSMAAMYGLMAAFCEGSLAAMVVRGLGKAVAAETRNLAAMANGMEG